MSDSVPTVHSARRRFTGKRAETVVKLTQSALAVLAEAGYHDLTLQSVAAHAGVARATVYMYFSSKEHLVAEVFWRRLVESARPWPEDCVDPIERVVALLHFLGLLVAEEPAFAHAVSIAMHSSDADVELLRREVGQHIHQLITEALGDRADPDTVMIIQLLHTGSMVFAGSGAASYEQVARQAESAARRILG
jgi:AcrR family transcriptional regulator